MPPSTSSPATLQNNNTTTPTATTSSEEPQPTQDYSTNPENHHDTPDPQHPQHPSSAVEEELEVFFSVIEVEKQELAVEALNWKLAYWKARAEADKAGMEATKALMEAIKREIILREQIDRLEMELIRKG